MPRGFAPARRKPRSLVTALIRPSDHGRRLGHLVTAAAQVIGHPLVGACLHGERPRDRASRIERGREVVGVVRRIVDGGLQVHPVDHVVQEEADRPLVLLVTTRCPERHVGLALAEHQAWRQRGTRPAPWRERAGESRGQREHLAPGSQTEPQARHDRRALQPAAARSRRDEVPEAIGDVEVAGVARAEGDRAERGIPQSRWPPRSATLRRPRSQGARAPCRPASLAPARPTRAR